MKLRYFENKNENMKKIYGHDDCAAFADIMNWNFLNEDFDSKIIMAGNRFENHFYVKVQTDTNIYFCDVYGIFENEEDILQRYNFTIEDTEEILDYEEDDLFRRLVNSSYLYTNLLNKEVDDIEEEFFEQLNFIFKKYIQNMNKAPILKTNNKSKIITNIKKPTLK